VALRMLEVTVPEARVDGVCAALQDTGIVDLWRGGHHDGRGFARLLIRHENVEAVSDLLTDQFGREGGFRIVVLPVEATLPVPEDDANDEGTPAQEKPRGPARVSREELYQDLEASTRVTWVYLATVILSTLVAAVGLMRDDMAVIIGAMVIAPLLGPNVALSLSATLGDMDLAVRSLRTNVAGVATALTLSVAMGFLLTVDPTTPQIASRTAVGSSDLVIALAAGSAGTLAYTTGLSGAVIGVMVAVALLPPLVVAGLLAGAGHGAGAMGAFTLLVANVTCVNLAGVATFLAQKVRPRGWSKEEKARKSTRWAIASWLVMLAILGAVIALRG
jgi:uncharacterized hydrophobic protein (TIGR00341 family)